MLIFTLEEDTTAPSVRCPPKSERVALLCTLLRKFSGKISLMYMVEHYLCYMKYIVQHMLIK